MEKYGFGAILVKLTKIITFNSEMLKVWLTEKGLNPQNEGKCNFRASKNKIRDFFKKQDGKSYKSR